MTDKGVTEKRDHAAVTAAFVSIANTLAEGYDAVDMFCELTVHCAGLLDVASAGLLLADGRGVLHLMAASSQKTHDLELFQLQRAEGPCLDCYHAGVAVLVPDLAAEGDRWPQFVRAGVAAGFASVHALPMHLGGATLGTLGLFGTEPGTLNDEDLALGQALAHIASIALVAERAAGHQDAINEHLDRALRTRVALEQAKGLLAGDGDLDLDEAMSVLRVWARDHHQKLADLARAVVDRDLSTRQLLDHARSAPADQ